MEVPLAARHARTSLTMDRYGQLRLRGSSLGPASYLARLMVYTMFSGTAKKLILHASSVSRPSANSSSLPDVDIDSLVQVVATELQCMESKRCYLRKTKASGNRSITNKLGEARLALGVFDRTISMILIDLPSSYFAEEEDEEGYDIRYRWSASKTACSRRSCLVIQALEERT